MKLEDIFTAEELALIDAGEYRPGRKTLDAKLDLWAALEREACAAIVDANAMACHSPIYRSLLQSNADAIRARGNT